MIYIYFSDVPMMKYPRSFLGNLSIISSYNYLENLILTEETCQLQQVRKLSLPIKSIEFVQVSNPLDFICEVHRFSVGIIILIALYYLSSLEKKKTFSI